MAGRLLPNQGLAAHNREEMQPALDLLPIRGVNDDAPEPQQPNALPVPQAGIPLNAGLHPPPINGRQDLALPDTPKPRTFQQFFSDTSKDPCQGEYGRVMARFDPEAENAVPGEVLLEQAIGGRPDVHQA